LTILAAVGLFPKSALLLLLSDFNDTEDASDPLAEVALLLVVSHSVETDEDE
jgi:hypothetical protein